MKSDNKRIAKNAFFLYIRMFLIMVVSLYTSRVALSVLGFSDYGIYNVVGGLITMFTFLNGCMIEASTRFIIYELGTRQGERLKSVFNCTLTIHIVLAILIFILCETVGVWFLNNKLVIPRERVNAAFWVFQSSILTSMLTITQVPYNALIIAHEKMNLYAYTSVIEAVAKLGIVYLITISTCDTLILYSFSFFVLQFFVLFFYRFYCSSHFPESRLKICRDLQIYKNVASFAGFEFVGSFAYIIQGQGVNIILNLFFGPIVNAARGIAFQVQTAVMQFNNNFIMAVRPGIIKKYASNLYDEMQLLTIRSSCFSYYMMLMIMLPVMIEARNILSIWLGNFPDNAVSFLVLIFINCLVQIPGGPRNIVYKASGKVKKLNIAKTIITSIIIFIAYCWLRFYNGSPESAFFFVILSAITNEIVNIILFFLEIEEMEPFRYIIQVYGRCIIVTIVSVSTSLFLCSLLSFESRMISIVITTFISVFCVITTSLLLGCDKETRDFLKNFIVNKLKIND